ncbi:MAG TPA: ATP-binding protein [Thermoanaerobaculia bacterium]|nr:ATP-binding protein [Thermoanaerobaculia bacterium]
MAALKKYCFVAATVLLAGATIGLAALSFTRKIETFVRSGISSQRSGGALVVTSVDPQSTAALAGLQKGDRIITADGVAAASLPQPDKTLARPEYPHVLVVQRGDNDIRRVLIGKPSAAIDWKYLFLTLVGLLYLLIGFITLARERTASTRVFWGICLASFAIDVLTPAGPRDTLWKAFWLTEDFYRALLPPLLLHFFLIFPAPSPRRRWIPLLYVPGVVYLALQESPLFLRALDPARIFPAARRLWEVLFAIYGAVLLVRLAALLRQRRGDAQVEKQVRWIALGVVVGLSPFLVFSVLPEALGVAAPWLSKASVLPLVVIPLAFSYAILRWRLWDVEIFVREALATTAAVLLCGATFVVLNALLDRTLEGMADAGKNVVAFGSGLVLASLLVPMKKRITDVLEKIQYHETYRARRALLDFARDFSTPRPQGEVVEAIVARVEEGLHVVPCRLFLLEGVQAPAEELLASRLRTDDVWRLRGTAFGDDEPPAAASLHEAGFRTFFAMRCAGSLAGALGVGHKDGRVPLSTEDEALLTALMAQASLAYENARLYGALAERLEEIRTLQQYQEKVILSSSSGIVVLDGSGRIQSANPAFGTLVARSEQELVGLSLQDALPGVELPPDDGPEDNGGDERTGEFRIVNTRGEDRDLRVSVSAFQGDPHRRVVLIDDVTDRIRAERALAERERLASLGVLAAGVAHEVNTPIAGLSSYAQMLLADTPPGDPRYRILKKMERQTFRAAHLVSNLLEFARPRPAANSRSDLKSVVSNAAESVETTLGARQLRFELPEIEEPLWVCGDARELEQVFINLFTNARDASPERGEIVCRLERNGQTARVTILDRGAGISDEVRGRLFQPFFSTKKSGGTGLGLAISREIVRRHGGDMGLEPRQGGGVEAWVTLPTAAAQAS